MVPGHPAQRPHKGSRRRRREDHQRIASPEVPLPDHEHPAHGALQGVRGVRHQQLPHPVRRAGARAERQEQRGGGVCFGAHTAEHGKGQGTDHRSAGSNVLSTLQ